MKKRFTTSALILSLCTFIANAQPVISNGNNFPTTGTTANVYSYTTSTSYTGGSGANQTWNFSSYPFSKIAVGKWIAPSSSPYGATYPNANICLQIMDTSGTTALAYNYDRLTSFKLEQIALSVSANPSTAVIYTNYETELPFPFSFGNNLTDTFQKPSGSANTVQLTYDAYGTLTTPFGTYTNVARVYRYWGPNDYGYECCNINPLDVIVSYDNSSKQFICAKYVASTGIAEVKQNISFEIFPNPVANELNIVTKENVSRIDIYSISGKLQLTTTQNKFDISILSQGIYFVKVYSQNGVATQKFVKQ